MSSTESNPRTGLMVHSGLSAALAASICLAAANIIFVAVGKPIGEALLWSAWLAGITLGLAWAGTYFGVAMVRRSAGTGDAAHSGATG